MKTLIISLSALFFTTIITYSQSLYPRIGITASSYSEHLPYTSIHPRLDFTVGFGFNKELNASYSIQLELNYIQKAFSSKYALGYSQNVGTDTYSVKDTREGKYRLSFLEMPLLARAKFFNKKLFIVAGPYAAYGLGGRYKYTHNRTSSYLDPFHEAGSSRIRFGAQDYSDINHITFDKAFDFGFVAGLGAVIMNRFIIECRYSRGSNLRENTESRIQSLQLTVSAPIIGRSKRSKLSQ